MAKRRYPQGTIFTSKHNDAEHPLVYWKESDKDKGFFIGLMLTKYTGKGNIKMLPEHFTDGFIYKNTHVVRTFLDKPNEYEPLTKIGQLTPKGIKHIYDSIVIDESVLWDIFANK